MMGVWIERVWRLPVNESFGARHTKEEKSMRYRKNINCLTADQLHSLREALAQMYVLPGSNANSFSTIASFHGGPPTAYCRHGAPGFYTWHRAYLMAFEDAMRSLGCDITLPYWDWSSGPSTGVPEACRHPTYVNRSGATVSNPLYSGPRAAGGQTSRRADIDATAYDDLATSAQAAMSAATFDSFQNQINGVHGSVHVRTGGDMGSVPTASYDPIFFLHHANIDRLWAQWQTSHPGSLPASEAMFELPPFNRLFTIQWQRGSDVESTDALGYRYRRFCFIIPPIRLWEVSVLRLPWLIRDQMATARILIKSTQMQTKPLEIRAFFDQSQATVRTKTIGNPAFAGAVGFLGHGTSVRVQVPAKDCAECAKLGHTDNHAHHDHDHHDHHHIERPTNERFDVELDVSAALRNLKRDNEEVALKLVVADANGEEVSAADVGLEDIEIVVE
jgi:tyrosinase